MTGRPTKLTPALQKRLVATLRAGNYRQVACDRAGISYQTFLNWLAAGRDAGEGPFFEFLEAVKRAEAYAETRLLRQIKTASVDNWQAAAWILERKTPDRWGRRDKVTVDLAVQRELERALDKLEAALDRETYARVLGAIAGEDRAEPSPEAGDAATDD